MKLSRFDNKTEGTNVVSNPKAGHVRDAGLFGIIAAKQVRSVVEYATSRQTKSHE